MKRPLGIFVGISLCGAGLFLCLWRFWFIDMVPFYFAWITESVPTGSMGSWGLLWGASLWPIAGAFLLVLGIVELMTGSTKLEPQSKMI